MLLEVIKFEVKYRLNRPATYIYFGMVVLLAYAAVAWPDVIQFGGATGKVKQNASVVLFNIAGIFSLIPCLFIASAIMGVPILRDFEHKMESLIFTTNINKTSYLLGRFLGSFLILVIVSSGFLWGTWLGCSKPWGDHSKYLHVGFYQYVKPWLTVIVLNMFVFSCLFFAIGALTRKMLFVYLQSIVLVAIYAITTTLIGDVENLHKAALADPFATYTVNAITRYWTVAEKNTLVVPFGGLLLINRLIWIGIGLVFMIITFSVFKFRSVYTGLFKKRIFQKEAITVADTLPIPFSKPIYNASTWFSQVTVLTKLYFKEIIRSIPFLGIAGVGLVLIAMDAAYATSWYGQELYPLSSLMAEFVAGEVILVIIIMTLFYSGELIWKEKEIRFNQIFDALPTSYAVPIVSKYLAMGAVLLLYVIAMIPIGALMQITRGFGTIELGVYLKVLLLRVYIGVMIYMAITMFIQSIFSNKFVGYAVSIVFYIFVLFEGRMKIFYNLLAPNSGTVGTYSDMNGFAAELEKFWVLKLFWIGVCGLLLLVAVLFYQRGTDTSFKARMANSRQRFGRAQLVFAILSLMLALGAGSFYYINTNIRNKYRNSENDMDLQARYEKDLKHRYDKALQPSVVDTKGSIDLVPEKGNMNFSIVIKYKNLFNAPINQLLVQEPTDDMVHYTTLKFNAETKLVKEYPDYRFKVLQLKQPLKPGDSIQLTLVGQRVNHGFVNGDTNTTYVVNGTFFNNFDFIPTLGYSRGNELGDTDERKKRGLKEQAGLPKRTDTLARQLNLFGERGRTNLDLTLSTAPDQIAISPGYLEKKWMQNGRAYFHYKMDKPIFNFFNIISGRYEVKHDKWNGVNLEIYYHKDHPFNVNTMITALKNGLDYDSKNFSPFLFHQMRIIEYPKYRTFAQSFPNTVPFSEGIGFIFRKKPEKLDMTYYVTAHELGHQWWGHQVAEANTVGSAMFSESLAQYSALMLLKKTLQPEELRRYLKYELDGYLSGRATEKKNENPLDQTDNQAYIHYQKGTLANFAMQDYIGEENMNKALRKLLANYGNGDKYPTTDVLTGYIKEVTPDSLKYVVDDLYSKITLFENRVVEPTAKKVAGGYLVTIPVQTVKYYADRAGNEKETPVKDYIDIGVFSMVNGQEKLIYLKREKFTKFQTTVTAFVKDKPERAGIDPIYKLIDRNTDDNTAVVEVN
ncbi:M1 family aminopeptidase [Mucilaginibacter sp. dw_454]|uniref:ABC transporter permease/M1 family aminopeptidase n=1 Tax=Mucilaginibacter sp. dw_454 TaxID=2720079 RepID=UPI001BD36BF1|nr:M1 family aminopeptidase [Mucilaginibacter sp. dw_454]